MSDALCQTELILGETDGDDEATFVSGKEHSIERSLDPFGKSFPFRARQPPAKRRDCLPQRASWAS